MCVRVSFVSVWDPDPGLSKELKTILRKLKKDVEHDESEQYVFLTC